TPMKGAPGMRTFGICSEVAQPSLIFQCTRKGSVMTSRRKPRPGRMALNAVGSATMSANSISSMSPGFAPLTNTGPVSGCTAPTLRLAKSATVERVAGLQRDLLALADLDDRRDLRVIAVVAAGRFLGERLAPIDADRMHERPPYGLSLPGGHWRAPGINECDPSRDSAQRQGERTGKRPGGARLRARARGWRRGTSPRSGRRGNRAAYRDRKASLRADTVLRAARLRMWRSAG